MGGGPLRIGGGRPAADEGPRGRMPFCMDGGGGRPIGPGPFGIGPLGPGPPGADDILGVGAATGEGGAC